MGCDVGNFEERTWNGGLQGECVLGWAVTLDVLGRQAKGRRGGREGCSRRSVDGACVRPVGRDGRSVRFVVQAREVDGSGGGGEQDPGTGNFDRLVTLFRARRCGEGVTLFREVSPTLSERQFSRTFSELCRASVDAAEQVLDEMVGKGIIPSVEVVNAMLKAFSVNHMHVKSREKYGRLDQLGVEVNTVTINILIDAAGEAGDLEGIDWCLEELYRRRLQPDNYTFNILLKIYAKCADMRRVEQILEEMRRFGLSPDTVTYNTLMYHLARSRRYDDAERIRTDMKNAGVRADDFTYNTLLKIYDRKGDMAAMAATFQEMNSEQVKPNLITYNTLIDAFARRGMADAAEAAYRSLRKSNLTPTVVVFNTMLKLYASRGNLRNLQRILSEMTKLGVYADGMTFNIRIDALGRTGRLREAEETYQQMLKSNCVPSTVTFNTLMKAHARKGDMHGVRRWYELMCETNERPDAFTLGILVDCYGKEGNVDEAERIYFILRQEGIKVDTVVFNSLLWLYSSKGFVSKFMDCLDEMELTQVPKDVYTYNIIIEAWRRVGDYPSAWSSVRDLLESNATPDATTSKIVERLCSGTEHVDVALYQRFTAATPGKPAQNT